MSDSSYLVERAATITAPPDVIYDLVADFHAWPRWSPWEDLDPALERTYSGAESGAGAAYAWSGNRKAGRGRMEILEATRPSKVVVALEFEKPFRSQSTTTFTIVPQNGSETEVRWAMAGKKPTVMRLLGFAFSMDKLVARDFEKGLARLQRAAVETNPPA